MGSHDNPAVSLALRSYSGQVELHDHDFHQLVLPQSGFMDIEVDGRAGKVDWSQGVVIPAGARHAFLAQKANIFLVLDVPATTFGGPKNLDLSTRLQADKRFFPVGPEIRHLLEYASRSAPLLTSSPQVAESWSTLLLSSLTLPPGIIPEHGQFTLARALAYIESHLDSRLSATEIARVAGTSERQLYVLFARHLNSTPFAHIATLRLNRAIDLLCETALSITEIAHRVGYADQSALTHALKKNRDLTPATVRRSSRVR
ncbi:AraC family transcriptional regulator [Pseudomonas carnis]|uniref:helix-turn-helix domain-containing protein n=1 Tax=Pseudomonas carnis TaxID=2487355 RepID=UPI002095F2F2|nr:AraC family transcriptional regulator [Pseudomonas carnis]MCO7035908.1 AraC family transcriptional regulator [Pseudomonas carnis]